MPPCVSAQPRIAHPILISTELLTLLERYSSKEHRYLYDLDYKWKQDHGYGH